ncbi:MAG: cell division protein SepF [Clostridia bacterium]|nr:cell division protein SepF [Clostridia bacterium]
MGLMDGAKSFFDRFGFFGGDEDLGVEDEDAMEEYSDAESGEDEEQGGAFFDRLRGFFSRDKKEDPDIAEAPRQSYTRRTEPTYEPAEEPRNNIIRDERLVSRNTRQQSSRQHTEHLVNVHQIEECREIIRFLLQGETVILNLENADPKDCGRIVDLLSGAAYALQGRMIKAAHLCYMLAPQNVEVIEDKEQHSSVRNRYST